MFNRIKDYFADSDSGEEVKSKARRRQLKRGLSLARLVYISEETLSVLNIASFLAFGILTFMNMEILFTAAEDILSGYKLPTASLILCFVAPLVAVKLTLPWVFQAIPYVIHVSAITTFMIIGTLFVVFLDTMAFRMLGLALNAMATGASEMTFLALTAYYPKVCISAFVCGNGIAALLAPLYYTAATTWGCISPRTAIMIVSPWPIFFLIFYLALDKEVIRDVPIDEASSIYASGSRRSSKRGGKSTYKSVSHKELESESDTADEHKKTNNNAASFELSCSSKVSVACKLVPLLIPMFVSFFAEYLAMTSVVTTISLPDSHLKPRDHYLYYSLFYRAGKFVGRSYLFLLSCLPRFTDCMENTCQYTWIFAVCNVLQLVFLLFESWYHFVPHVEVIIAVCSGVGIFAGLIVLHSPHLVPQVVEPFESEFALSLLSIGNGLGGLAAAVLGLYLEPYLASRCLKQFETSHCITRYRNMTSWDTNLRCNR